jgi:hypothetical protein
MDSVMSSLVALAAIVGAVAIVAIVLRRPFRGRMSGMGIEITTEPAKPRRASTKRKRRT